MAWTEGLRRCRGGYPVGGGGGSRWRRVQSTWIGFAARALQEKEKDKDKDKNKDKENW